MFTPTVKMRIAPCIFFLLCLLRCSSAFAQTEAFIWMIGTWKSEKKDIYETWKPGPSSSFIGQSFTITEGDTLVVEEMKIIRANNLYYYVPGANGQKEIPPLLIRRFNMGAFFAHNDEGNITRKVSYELIKNTMQKSQSAVGARPGNYTFIKIE